MTDKEQAIRSLFDEAQLKQEIAKTLGKFDPMRWSLDAKMNDSFDALVAAGKPYEDHYRDEEGYIYQSCWNCATNSESDKYTAIRNLALEHNYRSALDYGCAVGTGIVMLALEGLRVIGADICRPSLRFLQARLDRFELNDAAKVLDLNDDSILRHGKFDLVVCTEVFEHVFDPIELAWKLADITNIGGRLVLSWSFVDMTAHVKENFYLNTPHPDQLETAGFGKILKDEVGLKLDRNYGGGSGYLWFNNSVWIKP